MMVKTYQKLKFPHGVHIPILSGRINNLMKWFQIRTMKKQKLKNNIHTSSDNNPRIIVSLTSFPARTNIVYWTLKTLLNQTVKVNRIILWLAEEQFSKERLPQELTEVQDYGVSIRFCDDLRSHKKYYYSMLEYPNDIIITVDDDIVYPEDTIEKLLKKYEQYPDCVVCNEGREITFNEDKIINRYSFWKKRTTEGAFAPSSKLVPIGCGGVLYPPHSLDKRLFDKRLIKDLAWFTDDLWLKCMSALNKTMVVKTDKYSRPLTPINDSQTESLNSINVNGGNNDLSMKKLIGYFPQIIEFIQNGSNNIF